MKKVKVSLRDENHTDFEKEGDFGLVAIGKHQKGRGPVVEVDLSDMTGLDIVYTVATILTIVGRAEESLPLRAIGLFTQGKMRGVGNMRYSTKKEK